MTTKLFRPVGLHELALIWDSGMREFPPRLSHQPIFYPVTNIEYATQIAKDWNTVDEASGFAGFVTSFKTDDGYLSKFQPHVVGAASHVEYWIPAEKLPEFNASIQGLIGIESSSFGPGFQGCVPDQFGLKGKDAVQQFISLSAVMDYSRMDFVYEVWANRKAIFLNLPFWAQLDLTPFQISHERRDAVIERLREAWSFHRIDVPVPQ